MDFSSDTTNLVTRGPIDDAGFSASTTGNSITGYLYGCNEQNYVQKIEYANDTRRALSVTSAMPTMTANGADWYRIGDLGIDARSSGSLKGFEVHTPLGPQRGYPQTSYVYWNGGIPQAGYGGRLGCKYNMDNDTSIICGTRTVYHEIASQPSSTVFRPGATGNRDYSWWCAGVGSPYSSTIDRLDYSNDNQASVPRSTVSFSPLRSEVAAIGNLNYGYYMGGKQGSANVAHTDVQRLDFSDDTTAASPKGSLPLARGAGAAIGNQDYGYFAGGWNTVTPYVVYSNVYRVDYSNDTPTLAAKGNLTMARWGSAAASHATDGYVYAGYDPATPSSVDTSGTRVDRITFASDTSTASPKSAMPNKMVMVSASGNGTYAAVSDDDSNQSRVFRMDYSNDMLATSLKGYKTAPFNTAMGGFSDAVCSGENGMQASTFTPSPASVTSIAYFGGGPSPSAALSGNTMQKYDLSNDTSTTVSSLLIGNASGGWPNSAATGNSSYGFWGGGQPSDNGWRNMTKVDYANGFVGIIHDVGILVVSMYYRGAAVGNANYGYWSGGWNLSGPHAPSWPSTLVSRLDYSSDTDDCLNRGNMNLGRSYFDATGNQSYGYWAMGDNSGGTKVERLDYSSDTSLTTVGDLVEGGQNAVCCGNGSYGYWTYSNNTKLQRVDYSSDTSTGTEKGPLVSGHPGGQGTGNNTYAYYAGGMPSSQNNWSIIERLTYASDTTTAVPKGNLDTQLNGYCGDGVGAADYALPQ